MKKLWTVLLLTLLSVTGSAFAQRVNMRANIPFDFIAGNKSISAGSYALESIGANDTVLLIHDADGKTNALTMSHGVISTARSDRTNLVFRKYGDQYFLAQVWTAGESGGRELPRPRLEQKLAETQSPTDVVVVAQLMSGK
jgi:hypothetical protein